MQPTVVASGPEALETLTLAADRGDPYRLMLLDVMMPGMDGYEVARRVRDDPRFNELTIVILSSIGRPEDAAATNLRIARTLAKPITQSGLLKTIPNSLGAVQAGAAPAQSIVGDPTAGFVPRKILLAEDGLVNRKVAVSLLTKRGHEVTVVENGQEAV